MRPTLIFDKSFLQSLSVNEAVLLDFMFRTNIPPVFLSETLADLQKELKKGRMPEQVVGNLAHKTPEFNSYPNVHHAELAAANLFGRTIPMDGRILLPGGKKVSLPDQQGVIFEQSSEAKALARWQRGQFLEAEREHAKAWRLMINNLKFESVIKSLNAIGVTPGTVGTLRGAYALADSVVSRPTHTQRTYELALQLLGIPIDGAEPFLERARNAGYPPLSVFAPYSAYFVKVELFFCIALAAKLLSPEKLTNRIDLSYLYYLPFCMIFVSRDKFHRSIVHLFLREQQDFLWGDDLKAALSTLEAYYDSLPEAAKDVGLINFAAAPPLQQSTLISLLWDKHIPSWRHQKEIHLSEEAKKKVAEEMKRVQDAPTEPIDEEESGDWSTPSMIKRKVSTTKGKWYQVPKDLPDEDGS